MRKEDSIVPDVCTLDHDGCVTCSDAGIPVRVVSLNGYDAVCEDGYGAAVSSGKRPQP